MCFTVCTIYRTLVAGSSQLEVEKKWQKIRIKFWKGNFMDRERTEEKEQALDMIGRRNLLNTAQFTGSWGDENILAIWDTLLFSWRNQSHDAGTKKAQKAKSINSKKNGFQIRFVCSKIYAEPQVSYVVPVIWWNSAVLLNGAEYLIASCKWLIWQIAPVVPCNYNCLFNHVIVMNEE